MEIENEGSIHFVGTFIRRSEVYRKPTNTGLFLHFQSQVDNRFKRRLVNTMVDRAFCLSSFFLSSAECGKLHTIFCLVYCSTPSPTYQWTLAFSNQNTTQCRTQIGQKAAEWLSLQCAQEMYHQVLNCLKYEMLFIKDMKLSLNTQSDSWPPNYLLDTYYRFFIVM